MGSGKTTLAHLIHQRWKLPLYDTDQLLEEKFSTSIPDQLTQNPALFRQREADLIAQLVQLDQGVISLGGGAVEHPSTRGLLKGKPVIFLDPGADICWQRVQADTQQRPLATDYDSFLALYKKRLPQYKKISRWHITADLHPEGLVSSLEKILRRSNSTG